MGVQRRAVLTAAAAWGWRRARGASLQLSAEPSFAFDWQHLVSMARHRAKNDFISPAMEHQDYLDQIGYDQMRAITFRQQAMPWGMMSCHHRHRLTRTPVALFLVQDGRAAPLPYRPEWFDYAASGIAPLKDLGYAGFALHDAQGEWASFQGASYFRCVGPLRQYGLSARGIAIDTGLDSPEEFPDFVQMYVANRGHGQWAVFCLLDGPSVCGAYRFLMARDAPWEVQAALFMRQPVQRMGIAPLTSMYWYGENSPEHCHDWRPEVHDSDGLLVAQAHGERLWRPLMNPPGPQVRNESHAMVARGGGFGLMQRDGFVDHYQSPEARYHLRPSAWVEPLGDWQQGALQLVILPTSDEYHDNVVAFWMPQAMARQGKRLDLRYRLWWTRAPWHGAGPAGYVTATRWGWVQPDVLRMVIDWAGLPQDVPCQAHIQGAAASSVTLRYLPELGLWQLLFDLSRKDLMEQGTLRVFLHREGVALSETWGYPHSAVLAHCKPC